MTDIPDTTYAMRACMLFGVALVDVTTAFGESEAEDYYRDYLEDLHATISSTAALLPRLGRDPVAASMRSLLAGASAALTQDPAGAEALCTKGGAASAL